ncbi:MAG: hypothetical protein IT499_10060 [Rubrivivax sp.]|nr:hypothetical protein [Rubrivivax sp.]MCL4697163.1 hypothetical protein [Burkholderiaceae bacterium]
MNARPSAPAGLLAQRLVALFVAGAVAFGFLLLALGLGRGAEATLFGLPRLPVLLFAGWAVLIVVLAGWMERADHGAKAGARGR